ncbi:aminoglycoside 6-adenylyltransferase [Cohnella nanjingensis]|uniref:Aminoglycoside 6-adenylyltransferase n=1 Tax=Cohnella nanjingensis TaxID=1387779 RepID=A0A7X0VCM8_9BACL|nr:aminoglycoside 6-adenylyltransferase [Cohnella nanjingensis]MBB6669085.1 aminoglycoside 6-adenylyltransferase [Cohnella nanjingensis]
MRTEQEMYDSILGVARADERIRAVYMNGSRTNARAPRDFFQDYDIVFVVTETDSFLRDARWIDAFGERLMLQEPDKNDGHAGSEADFGRSYGYLMLLADGNRIDLHIETRDAMLDGYGWDSLTVPLLDKDACLPVLPPSSDADYRVRPPTEARYLGCCNNFWWCLQNVAKGLWRNELPYAKSMFEQVVRRDLDEMVAWRIGIRQDFQVSAGKMGKYFQTCLTEGEWASYKATYSDGEADRVWDSVFAACELFRSLAIEVAARFGYTYPMDDDTNMTKYLARVRALPADAEAIF